MIEGYCEVVDLDKPAVPSDKYSYGPYEPNIGPFDVQAYWLDLGLTYQGIADRYKGKYYLKFFTKGPPAPRPYVCRAKPLPLP